MKVLERTGKVNICARKRAPGIDNLAGKMFVVVYRVLEADRHRRVKSDLRRGNCTRPQ